MLGKRIVGKGIMASLLFCMMAATAMVPCAVGAESDSFYVERHPPGAPSTDIVWYEWEAPSDGDVYLNIQNSGMASVTIAILENSTSSTLLAQTIRFQGDGGAVIDSGVVSVTGGTTYSFSAIPGGPPGCGGDLYVVFEPTSAPSTVTYRVYEMFEEPWGPWWDYRVASSTWDTERLLPTSNGDVTYLYSILHNPTGTTEDQGLIYAPYRYSVDAVNLGTMDVHDPVLMPTVGSADPGSAVSMDVYFQYLYTGGGDWDDVWRVRFADGDFATVSEGIVAPIQWCDRMEFTHLDYNDGYMTGTLIDVTMNRAAAEEWMGIPTTEDPLVWWGANGENYLLDWESWILTQGNDVFDIWCGYEWPYESLGTIVELGMDGDDVVLSIGHVSWGYEALITRWMVYADVSMHQPYMEDFSMTVDYRESDVDLACDGVAHWSLHCVKQNDAPNPLDAPCAWVWEPIALDYVTKVNHPSDYEPYVDLEYTSWNCGDVGYSTAVSYEYTPVEMDLAVGRTLVIEFPTDAVVGYRGEVMPPDSILKVWNDDTSEYTDRQYYGSMSLGYMNLNGNGYTLSGNVLTIEGPADFSNPHPSNPDYLYHGAPWIEFNVNP